MPSAPTEDAVRSHLGSILASSGFANSDRMSRFLQLTVEMKLRGEEGNIKEFVLGREVFDRGPDYDPRIDPIVRVEARRLRQRLAEYYEGPGRAESLRIEFPKGGYAPVIQVAAGSERPRNLRRMLIPAALILAAAAASAVIFRPATPALAVVPARWVWDDVAALDPADEPLAEQIIAQLANQRRAAVIGWPVVAQRRSSSRRLDALGRELGVDRIILVSVRRQAGQMRVTLFDIDAPTGHKGSAREYFADALDDFESRDVLARQIASDLTPQ